MSPHQVYPIPDTLTALQGLRDALTAVQRENLLAPAWLLMPNVLRSAWQQGQGSCLNVQTGDFARLSQWILDRAGQPAVQLAGARRQRLLQRLVQEVHARTPLQALGGSVSRPGFSRHLGQWLDEMRHQEISPACFQDHADKTGDPRNQDLALLYGSYAARLQASSWRDEAGIVVQACQVLQERDLPLLAFLGVTGYVQLTPLQARLVRGLAAGTPVSRVFWPVSSRLSDGPDQTARQMAETLDFAYVDDTVSQPAGPPPQQMAAPSQEQEVRSVLRTVKHLLVVDEVPAADIVLCVSRMDSYAPLLHAVAEEYGIPLDVPIRLSSHPLYVILRQILTLFPDLDRSQGQAVLRSPLLHQSFLTDWERDMICQLTAVCGVIRGQAQWDAAFTQDYDWTGAEAWDDVDRADLHAQQVLWEALQPPAGQGYPDLVRALLDESSPHPVHLVLPDTLSDAEQQRGRYVRDSILQAAAAWAVEAAEAPPEDAGAIRDGLLEHLAGVTYRSRQSGTTVRVLAFAAGWMLPTAHLFVLGLNERSLPRTPAAGPFFSWPERREHVLPLAQHDPGLDKLRWALLQANCRTALYLSRPTETADLPSTAPSPYWDPEAPCREMVRTLVPPPDQAASPSELLPALLRDRVAVYPATLQAAMARAQALGRVTDMRHGYRPAGSYEGILHKATIQQDLRTRFGANYAWSPTALGAYARCPMGFLARYVLRLTSPPTVTPGLDLSMRGLLLHAMLQELYRWIRDEEVALVEANRERIRRHLDRICTEQWARAGLYYRFQPYPLARYEWRELKRYAWWCVANELAEAAAQAEWEPWELEWNLAGTGIVIRVGVDSPFRLRGIVDRLDRNREGQFRVVDYKTRKAVYSTRELKLAITNQAVLYHLAAEAADCPVQVSGYRMLMATKDSKLRNVPDEDTVAAVLARIRQHQAAIRRGDFPNAPAMLDEQGRRCASYCELADFCQPTYSSARKAVRDDGT